MIPELPKEVSNEARLDFYSTLAGNLQDQSSIHVNWHTHRQNPSVCWICDMNILVTKVIDITKSALDIETEPSSENVSDSEIEDEDVDADGIPNNEPEYELEDA